MGQFLSSFQISVPEIPAKIYEISAELPDNPYSDLAHFENILSERSWGEAHRIRGGDGKWYIAVFGHEHEPKKVDADGITLSLEYKTTLNPENPRHRGALSQALRDGFGSYLTSVLDYWEYNGRGDFYEPSPVQTVKGEEATYEMFRGIRTSVDYQADSGFILSLDPTRKFVDEWTVADRLNIQGESEVINRFGDGRRYFFFDRPEPQPVRLHSVSDAVVTDETMNIDGEPTSVLSFVEDNYGSEWAGKIDPNEPVIKYKYSGGSRTYDAAPSLLRLIPKQEEVTTQASTLKAHERWKEVQEWIRPVHYIRLGDHEADIADEPFRDGVDTFSFPALTFGEDTVLEVGSSDLIRSGDVTRDVWEYRILDYLEKFGPRRKPMDEPWVAVLHTDSTRQTAFDAFDDLRSYVKRYADLDLKERPGGVSFESRSEYDQWKEEFAPKVTGAFAYLTGDSQTEYYDVINAVNGKPVQHIRHENYQQERNQNESYSLRNTATDLASKLGVRPFLLEERLHADVVIGLSVTGDQITTACSVTVSGETGDVIDWTKQPHGRGDSTVDDFDHAEKLIGDGIVEAINQTKGAVDSLVIHRNGTYGNEEIAGIQSAVDSLKNEGYIDDDFKWSAVELRGNTSYRIYSDETDCECRTGAYVEVDKSTMVLAPSGGEFTSQGTPRTFRIQERAGTEDLSITNIGQDIFDLSFLAWWSPGSKISDPITTRYPRKMHSLFESCPQLRFLPS